MRTALDPLVLAFKRDRANAAPFALNHYARLYWDDPLEFGWALNRAWEQRRPGALGAVDTYRSHRTMAASVTTAR